MTLNPKTRFLASEHSKFLADLVVNTHFQSSLEYAFLYWNHIQKPMDPDKNYTAGTKNEGIREFIDVLLNLAEPNQEPPKPIRQNLKQL
jgi:hypothetical protein